MERIVRLHSSLQATITLTLLVLVGWGMLAAIRGGVDRGYLGALAVAQLLLTAEAFLGLILFIAGGAPGRLALHLIYGAVAILILPAAWLWLRDHRGRRNALSYSAICLFLAGIAIRAFETG
ncbi:MAG: hypothetical protein HC822_13995 [Oscillochloris sp.]|nr:hypothetical protein [Oscillochloris sp.]